MHVYFQRVSASFQKSNNILRQEENFAFKDAIYNVLHFSDDMDKISEGKDPRAFLLDRSIGPPQKEQLVRGFEHDYFADSFLLRKFETSMVGAVEDFYWLN